MRRTVFVMITVICIVIAAFCIWKIYGILSEYRRGVELYTQIAEEYAKDAESEDGDEAGLNAPITVDFDALISENPDIVGWIYCEGTQINYPILQGEDNDAYLHHMADGSYNTSGSIFIDYRNSADFSDANTVIYGHNMKNGSMFGTLDEYKSQSKYDDYPFMWLLTPEGDYRLDILGGCVLSSDDAIYGMFEESGELGERIEEILSASLFKSRTDWEGEGRIVTLSTCSYEHGDARFVLLCQMNSCR